MKKGNIPASHHRAPSRVSVVWITLQAAPRPPAPQTLSGLQMCSWLRLELYRVQGGAQNRLLCPSPTRNEEESWPDS